MWVEGKVDRAVEIVSVEKPRIYSPPLEVIKVIPGEKKPRSMPDAPIDLHIVEVTGANGDSFQKSSLGNHVQFCEFLLEPKVIDGGFSKLFFMS